MNARPQGEPPTPLVSVIVPVKDDPTRLRKCLDALARQTMDRSLFEVIIVDNGSAEPVRIASDAEPNVTVAYETRPGSYAARNHGLEKVRGAVVVFTDADCVPAPDWLEHGYRALNAATDIGVVAGRIALFEEVPENGAPPDHIAAAFEQSFGYAKFDQERFVADGHCITANWFSRTETVRAAGGFDARLKSRGDFDLAERLRTLGLRIVYAPDAVVAHPIRATCDEIVAKQCRVVGGRWQAFEGRHRAVKVGWTISGNSVRRLLRVLRTSDLEWALRIRLAAFVVALWWACISEIVALERGRPPKAT